MQEFYHQPIMLNQILELLNIKKDGLYLDCTLGGGGHSLGILNALKQGHLYALDQDAEAIEYASERLKNFKNKTLIKTNFKDAKERLAEFGVSEIDGALLDLGISSHQIDDASRGFSFLKDAPLDMRMDKAQELSAYNVVNEYSEERLVKILFEYGEEPFAKSIAKNIVAARKINPIKTTLELKEIIENSMPKKVVFKSGGSKKSFQAIRIEVNGELKILESALRDIVWMLKPGGRICVLTFHSLEDRIVKNLFRDLSTNCVCPPRIPKCICNHRAVGSLINRKPIIADESELKENPRSAPAKLRCFEKFT